MSDNTVLSPWRDGTPEREKSADLFDRVVLCLLYNAPGSTESIRTGPHLATGHIEASAYIDSVIGDAEMLDLHEDYLLSALGDEMVLDLVDALARRVRLICDPIRRAVTA